MGRQLICNADVFARTRLVYVLFFVFFKGSHSVDTQELQSRTRTGGREQGCQEKQMLREVSVSRALVP